MVHRYDGLKAEGVIEQQEPQRKVASAQSRLTDLLLNLVHIALDRSRRLGLVAADVAELDEVEIRAQQGLRLGVAIQGQQLQEQQQ